MRYYLSNVLRNELSYRQQYIYDILHLWSIYKGEKDGYLLLEGFPHYCLDLFIIVGHNYKVIEYLNSHNSEIHEKTIIAVTCDGGYFKDLNVSNKDIFFSNQNKYGFSELYPGKAYGFEFNITESELLFFNNRKEPDIYKLINEAFTLYK